MILPHFLRICILQLSNVIVPSLDQKGTLAALLPLLKPLCGKCGKLITGEVALTQGILKGLAGIARSGPVVMDWEDGAVRLRAGLKVERLAAPFQGEASVRDISLNPDVNTRVENVGVDFGVEVRNKNGCIHGICMYFKNVKSQFDVS